MASILMTLFLTLTLACSHPHPLSDAQQACSPSSVPPQSQKLFWGMLDPELSAWFARVPHENASSMTLLQWDWSWRGFFSALFERPMLKEAGTDAQSF